MVSRLPITARPAHRELTVSYLARLAALHGMAPNGLWRQVSRGRRLDGDLLATLANQPRARLNRAIVELLNPEPDWLALRHEAQCGCHRCTARHAGGPVLQLLGHHDYVCTRPQIWIGPPDHLDLTHPSLDQLPEVVAAQHRHRWLLRRIGPAATFDAVLTGFLICAHRWNFTELAHDGDAWLDWRRRAELLIPPGTEAETFSASRLFAATYPEAVALAELLGSLRWRRLAAGDPNDQALLHRDRPAPWAAPLQAARAQRPDRALDRARLLAPAQPAGLRLPQSEDLRRARRIPQTGRHRRGGDAMLHHRSLLPVVVRDWSSRMELFTTALALTVATSVPSRRAINIAEPRSPRDYGQLAFTAWFRPHAQPSPYLDSATEPVPWPDREGHQHPATGGRPLLPNEHRTRAKMPIQVNRLC